MLFRTFVSDYDFIAFDVTFVVQPEDPRQFIALLEAKRANGICTTLPGHFTTLGVVPRSKVVCLRVGV